MSNIESGAENLAEAPKSEAEAALIKQRDEALKKAKEFRRPDLVAAINAKFLALQQKTDTVIAKAVGPAGPPDLQKALKDHAATAATLQKFKERNVTDDMIVGPADAENVLGAAPIKKASLSELAGAEIAGIDARNKAAAEEANWTRAEQAGDDLRAMEPLSKKLAAEAVVQGRIDAQGGLAELAGTEIANASEREATAEKPGASLREEEPISLREALADRKAAERPSLPENILVALTEASPETIENVKASFASAKAKAKETVSGIKEGFEKAFGTNIPKDLKESLLKNLLDAVLEH